MSMEDCSKRFIQAFIYRICYIIIARGEKLNGKDMKIILPLAVVIILILSIVGIALMSMPKENGGTEEVNGPYLMSVGPITDENGEPIEGAIVTLMMGNTTIASEVTNKNGYASFSFDKKIEKGKYKIEISRDGFNSNLFEVDLDYSGNNILLHIENTESNMKLIPKTLPPLKFTVGPIWGTSTDGLLAGVAIELRLLNNTIAIEYTDANGTATFTFETPPEDGTYILNISFINYTSIEREILVDYDENTQTLSVIGNFDGLTLEPSTPPEPLPPLKMLVGPITGQDVVLKGITVELLYNNKTVLTENSDENGLATFTFETPPLDGVYFIRVTAKDFEIMDIEITLKYNEELHELIITGQITNITLVPIIQPEPPEPKNDPDYYKGFDAYKELQDKDSEPVDVEERLDPNNDGTPEFNLEIVTETEKNIDVDQYVGLNNVGEPKYAPEINNYEAADPGLYMSRQARESRSISSSVSGSGTESNARSEWKEPNNLTHYDDIIILNEILDNGTTEIMKYNTNVVDSQGISEFNAEVADVGNIINNSLKVGYINGTNASDANNDGKPEHLVIWKVVYLLKDRNNDKKPDHKIVAVLIYDVYDNNSNGIFEYSRGFTGALNAYDNDYNGQFEEKIYAVAVGEEAKIDGNITKHFKRIGIFYNHTVDKNNDSVYELHRAAMYIQLYFDNNSNGNFELVHQFAGGIELIDNNSNRKYESLILVWAGNVLWDKNDDGIPNINKTFVWILSAKDKNEDKKPEDKWLLHTLNLYFDNNSNGNIEFSREIIAGYRAFDNDSNGLEEHRDALRAVKHTWDLNDDGIQDANVSRGHVFLWRDKNQDNKPEYQLALFYLEQFYDNNSNGNFEFTHKLIQGFLVIDTNSDGNANELRAVHYGVAVRDLKDNGKLSFSQSFGYALHFIDKDDDANLEYKHAVFGNERKWDNNTDGIYETVNQLAAGYEGRDDDDDGQIDVERFFILANRTIDKNHDGNPEFRQITIFVTLRVYNSSGGIIYGRDVVHSTVAYDNNSNGNFELVRSILLGHVGYNGTQNGSKIDWETEKVLLYFTEMKDNDDNGTWDKVTGFKVVL